jgi:hypothetical protein
VKRLGYKLGEQEVLGGVVQAAPGATRSPLRVGPVPGDHVEDGLVVLVVADAADGGHHGVAAAFPRLVDQADGEGAVLARHVDAGDVLGAVRACRLAGVVAEHGAVDERADAALSR